ncbi:MAG: hypothetical protein ABGY21_08995 [Pseudomonadota bacterium]
MGQKYNGWTNRETWLVNVWFNPECEADVELAKEFLENEEDKLREACPCLVDMCYLSEVNWDELDEAVKTLRFDDVPVE